MFYNKKIFLILIIIFFHTKVYASFKNEIIEKLKVIENVTFNFEQNINGKIEKGKCTIAYPKKIYCKYNLRNQKILVTNGKSLVIKTINGFYQYELDRTPLNFILDKEYLLKKLNMLDGKIVEKKFIHFSLIENDTKINLFFDKKTFNLVGWQTVDIYQNSSITYINSIIKNRKVKNNLFNLPDRN